jgi:subtilisin family serine protease
MKHYLSTPKNVLAAAVLATLILTGCEKESFLNEKNTAQQETAASSSGKEIHPGQEYMPNEVLVKFKAGVSESARAAVLSRVGGKAAEKILTKAMQRFGDNEGITLVTMPLAAMEALGRLKGAAEIEYAEPNYIYRHTAVSNDPSYTDGSLWGMYGESSPLKTNAFGSQAGEAWAIGNTGSETVYVGIIDEGVMHQHEDLFANIGNNSGEIAGNNRDDDGNGYVDDVYGWDFDGNNNSTYDGTQDDHGTHVAGTIGAVGGNGKGVAGVCWKVKMLTAKFLGRNGGTTANAIRSVDYFTGLKTRPNNKLNIVATNNSWGGGGYSQGLYDAIKRADEAGILFIAAAGNGGSDGIGDNNDVTKSYPSGYELNNVIAVASITSSGAKSNFSNFGATSVHIGAPGSGIWSTVPGRGNTSGYTSYSGTSMATPHVSGGAALYASTHAGASAATIKNAILSSSVPTSSLSGKTVTGGRLNVSGF